MYQLGVVGNPIEHSLSPLVFDIFAKECDISLNYKPILAVNEDHFKQIVQQFFLGGGMALNITSPFKYCAYQLALSHMSRSSFCNTSNFLFVNSKKQITADTADGIGLVADLEINLGIQLFSKNILIIGSGYVVDSILLDLIQRNPSSIDIIGRNFTRVNYLSQKFMTGAFNPNKYYDIILNTTLNLPNNELFHRIINIQDGAFCYDLTYTKHESLFLKSMVNLNNRVKEANGLGMLVEQAKIVFIKLFAKHPSTANVFRELAKVGYSHV